MAITLDRLVFDASVPDNGANVGAYLRDSAGALLTSTLNGAAQSLDVNITGSVGTGVYDEDTAHVSGDKGQFIMAVRNDADASLTSTDGDYSPIAVDEFGRVKVLADLDVDFDYVYAEDAAHASGDLGVYQLAVIQGTLAASAADGDYGSMKTDLLGRLWMNRSGQSAAYGATSVAATATDIIATDLANRIKVIVQNVSNKDVYIGSNASVTTANGIRLSAGSSIELEVGPGVNLHGIASSGTADIRYFEVA